MEREFGERIVHRAYLDALAKLGIQGARSLMFRIIVTSIAIAPSGARGHRAYVVGDIHGRLDLLDQLAREDRRGLEGAAGAQEPAGVRRRPDRPRSAIGPGNRAVADLSPARGPDGLPARQSRGSAAANSRRRSGVDRELASVRRHPVPQELWRRRDSARLADGAGSSRRSARPPPQHVEFLESFLDTCRFGDYLFVHAGIRPGVELEQQTQTDLRWIREPFLFDDSDHGFTVVHGHTISAEVEERANRIGIDTGAYRTGILTALVIDGAERRLLDTRAAEPLRVRSQCIDLGRFED